MGSRDAGVRVTRELVSDEPWSTVWRLDGDLWLKQPKGAWRFEVPLTVALASRWPDRVPEIVDHGDDWLLTRDAGVRIAVEDPLWLDAVRRYVELQQGEAAHADEHVAAGVPDRRLATLPEWYAQLVDDVRDETLRRFAPRFAELCAELASRGIPETIQHDDFHDGQIFVRDGRYLFFDWGDACVSQPFFTLSVTLEGVLRWGLDDIEDSVDIAPFRDAYLEPFERYATRAELVEATSVAFRLGWLSRALSNHELDVALGVQDERDVREEVRLRLELAFSRSP